MNEGPEEFAVQLSASTTLNDVILDPSTTTITISDSVDSIVTEIFILTESGDQTEENLENIGFTIVDITNSATTGDIVLDTEVCVIIGLTSSAVVNMVQYNNIIIILFFRQWRTLQEWWSHYQNGMKMFYQCPRYCQGEQNFFKHHYHV